MTNKLTQEKNEERKALPQQRMRQSTGFFRLLGGSAILMSLILPVGVIPRIMQSQELEKTHEKIVSQLPIVNVVAAKPEPSSRELQLPGSVEAIVETPIYARTNGYARERSVDIGDRVKAGQLLARIDTPEMDETAIESQALVLTNIAGKAQTQANRQRAQADLDRALAGLSQAKADVIDKESDQKLAHSTYMRWKALGAQGAVSMQEVDERETKYKTTTAETEVAVQRVKAAESEIIADKAKLNAESATVAVSDANIAAARAHSKRSSLEKGFQNVVSPFAGIITERNFDTGTLVSSGSENTKVALYRLARIDVVKVFVDVPQYASSGIKTGQSVKVSLKEFPNRVFTGIIARTSVALDPNSRTLRTEIHLPNKDLALAPGMYADVNFNIPRTDNLLIVPANAVVTRSAGPQVAVMSADKKVHFRNVVIGEDLGKEIEITSGLKSGDFAVVNPSDAVTEGATVTTN